MAAPTKEEYDALKVELDGFKASYRPLQVKLDEALQREKDMAQAHLNSLDAERKLCQEAQAKDAATITDLRSRLDMQAEQQRLQNQALIEILQEKPAVRELRAKHARDLAELHAKL